MIDVTITIAGLHDHTACDVIVNVFRVLGSKQMIEGCFNDVSQKL